ncbi:MAG: AAA family ATPase [Candidatus Poseidoniales archaeon]|nr:MAG: AAA family ATPase [Candidatus Poseidoniales archaeon]
MALPSDWTERHRPSSEQMLEGNEVQRRTIRNWLDEWANNAPKKKALLLIGPPGVGKTTVARAIAEDMGWNVIELNASDARNAAAIRKAATSGATHRSLFHDPTAPPSRTLILLDEVDHLSGGLRAVNQDRISKAMTNDGATDPRVALRGDSGGKAELLSLLEQTKQPVVLACNDEMGLWGKNSSWRNARDRFSRHLVRINFVRATDEALRRIARRVLREEGIDFEDDAIDALTATNHGDLRALVRDLQVMTSDLNGARLTADIVQRQAEAGARDVAVEIFPGLDRLYKASNSTEAVAITRTIDKDPSEFLNWIHWNNPSLFEDKTSVRRSTKALTQADRMMMGRYLNTAHRSSYWTHHLTALAASVANSNTPRGKLWPSYPQFLRRSGSSVRPSIVSKLSMVAGMSKAAVRDEFLTPLQLMHREDGPLGDPNDFQFSLALGLEADEHAALCGLAKSRRSTKQMMKAYEERQTLHQREEEARRQKEASWTQTSTFIAAKETTNAPDNEPLEHDGDGPQPGQTTLF